MATKPLIVIVGETASGKSALGLELAKRFNGEIICADSRTVYKGMDIGTAKPTAAEQAQVPHHLLDLVTPNERFTVADFKELATKAIEDIGSRRKLPIMVGGTGLYIDSILFDYQFSDPNAERDRQNPRHLKRTKLLSPQLRPNTLVIGLRLPREWLTEQIKKRVDYMIENDFVDEVRRLGQTYGWEIETMKATGYQAFKHYLEDKITLDEAKALFIQNDLHLAKKQRTWFKRNKSIHWLTDQSKAVELTTTFLNKLQ